MANERKTTVRGHVKKRKTGRFNWRRHKRTIEYLQEKKRQGKKYATAAEIKKEYKKKGYTTKGLGASHGADEQLFKQNPDGTQDHARIWVEEKKIVVEEHTDLVSPKKDPLGHVIVDVGAVTASRELANANENRTKKVVFKKKEVDK